MLPFEDDGGVAGSRGWQKKRGHRRQLSSPTSFGSVSSLPEYRRSGRHTPTTSLSAIWDTEEDPTPPPDYSDPVRLVLEAPSSAEEADEESEEIFPSPRRRLIRHRRSHSLRTPLQHKETNIDAILERSVNALEMSNALLQSSMSTRDTLSNVLADDPSLDRSLENHAQYLSRRLTINQEQEAGMADIMKSVDSLLDGVSRSAPSTTSIHLQMEPADSYGNDPFKLPPDTEPSHSFSPELRDPLPTYPSQSSSDVPVEPEHSEYYASTSTSSALPPVTQRPFFPSTPAYHLLSSIVARAPPSPSSHGHQSNRTSPLSPSNMRRLSSASTGDLRSRATGSQQATYSSRMIWRVRSSDDASGLKETPPNSTSSYPMSSLVPIMTPRFFISAEKRRGKGRVPIASKTVKALRQILADDAGVSEVVRGKRPAKDEGFGNHAPVKGKGAGRFPLRTPPRATLALVGPSGSTTKVVPLDVSPPFARPSPPRSAMRGKFPSPESSGRSTPRNVSFSVLPPKRTHRAAAPAPRTGAPSGRKRGKKMQGEEKPKGWLSEWFIGDLPFGGARAGFGRDRLEGWMV